ncbi:MAG TPA: ATP-binding protein [Albitalea sp.]
MQEQPDAAAEPIRPGSHVVQFYKEDHLLLDEVVDFVDGALRAGDAGLVIATQAHLAEIERRLQGMRLAVGAPLWYPGEFIGLDAARTLAQFMTEGWPDEERFTSVVGDVIARASNGGQRGVRAFGEMVALLCAAGNHAAAIRLEELWCELGRHQAFSLFCAYPLNLFTKPDDARAPAPGSDSRAPVAPTGAAPIANAHGDTRTATLAELQHKAAVLEVEVAKRTQAEQTLRRREKELADFLENAAEGLNRIGADGRIVWANRAELELLGYEPHDYIGQPAACFHADPDAGCRFVERLLGGDVLYNEPAVLRCRDGTLRHVLVHASLVGDNGGPRSARCFTRDVTEQVRAREVLETAHGERTRLLEKLETANRAKDEFLAMLGHELRNPLSPIVTALQLMKMRGDSQTAREQAIIQRQVDHLTRLVDDLLDISKLTRGKIQLHMETVEIGEVLNKAVEMAGVLLEQRQHRLVVHVPGRGMRWHGDPVRLAQVVSNLLTNAARYTPIGGEVRLSAFRDTSQVTISVRDNGCGIAPHMLSRVFDLFVQGERGVDRAEGGLGIGLALVKSLVGMHGGTVAVKSEGVGRGSEFIVRLPLQCTAAVATHASIAAAPAAQRQRVLVVDDNADAADMLGLALRAQGHEVVVAHDPITALKSLDGFTPDVAVLDIGLPVMDGYELAARLRERLGEGRCRLYALTGYGLESDRMRSKAAGFDLHLVKPVNIDRLLALVDEAAHVPQGREPAR